jgi:hypothetical protein
MKLETLNETLISQDQILTEAFDNYARLQRIQDCVEAMSDPVFMEFYADEFDAICEALEYEFTLIEAALDDDHELLLERVERQFRRYGDKFVRQYRCTSGPKKGRLVASPEKCGMRKDPMKVRQGKKSARIKKGSRKRKTAITKSRANSKRVTRLNKVAKGAA